MRKNLKKLKVVTLQLLRWKIFLEREVGLKEDLSTENLKELQKIVSSLK